MPLTQVRPGMRCTGLSVVRGTAISQFDVEVIDVIGAAGRPVGPADPGARLGARRRRHRHRSGLLRLADPVPRGRRGPRATPARSPRASASTATTWCSSRRSRRCCATRRPRRARPRRAPAARSPAPRGRSRHLTVSGLSPAHARPACARRAAGRAPRCWPPPPARSAASRGSSSCPAPRWPRRCPRATSRSARSARSPTATAPASGPSATRSRGSAGASLFLEDAYVFSVISNPFALPDFGAGTYKLTSAGGHVQGTISSDAVASIAGTVGRSARRDSARGGGARDRRRGPRGQARLAAGRRAHARLRRRPVVRGPARRLAGARAAAPQLRAGHHLDVLSRQARRARASRSATATPTSTHSRRSTT